MSTDKMREEFEEYWRSVSPANGLLLARYTDGSYAAKSTEYAWGVWQASRASLVVELPDTELTGSIGMAKRSALKQCRAALEAAGITVKE